VAFSTRSNSLRGDKHFDAIGVDYAVTLAVEDMITCLANRRKRCHLTVRI
jgi:hypothetical protein